MKFLLVLVIALNLYADEIQRINSIVNDISKLRMDYKQSQEELSIYKNRVKILQNKLKIANNLLKTKQKPIENIIVNDMNYFEKQTNVFPKLKMRTKIISFKASAFRLNKNAHIYGNLNGRTVYDWEKDTSFTSNQKTDQYIKITGYFKNKVWTKARRELWVKIADATKRDVK